VTGPVRQERFLPAGLGGEQATGVSASQARHPAAWSVLSPSGGRVDRGEPPLGCVATSSRTDQSGFVSAGEHLPPLTPGHTAHTRRLRGGHTARPRRGV